MHTGNYTSYMYLRHHLSALTLLFAILFNTSGCSTDRHTSPSLANQGILSLSSSNAYLGSNLFLAQQAEYSPILYKFLKARGGPVALELIDQSFSSPRLLLYYPREREVYAADLEKQKDRLEWIVRGPFAIHRSDFSQLTRMESSFNAEPLFVINGKETRFKSFQNIEKARVLTPHMPIIVPTPTPKPVIKKKPKTPIIRSSEESQPGVFKPLNSDQQAIQMSKGFAERADNGDVIHNAKGENETVESIAKWYCGDISKGAEIASLNGLKLGDKLAKGARVRVPIKVVKNFKQMP